MDKIDISANPFYIKNVQRVVPGELKSKRIIHVNRRHSDGFIFILEGSCHYRFDDGTEFTVTKGDILYLPFQSVYVMSVQSERYRHIFCDFEFDGDEPRKGAFYRPQNPSDTENRFHKLLNTYKTLSRRTFSHLLCTLYEIYGTILQAENRVYREKGLKEKLEEAKSFLEGNYADPNLSIEALSEKAGMSAVYFRRLFKEYAGCSPLQYRTERKMERAKELMERSDISVGELSHILGYDDPSYFCRVFKKTVGMSPSEYRKRIEER